MKMPKLWIIGGPTASGKTAAAIRLAKKLRSEIISFDSRQFYKETRIGTAMPSDTELAEVPHHFIGHLSVQDAYDVSQYAADARARIQLLGQTYDNIVLVGGSGFYMDAVLFQLDSIPEIDPALRIQLETLPLEEMLKQLAVADPESMRRIDVQNPRRVLRALEVSLGSEKPFSQWHTGKREALYPFEIMGIEQTREELYQRINYRTHMMFSNGLPEECKTLLPFKHLQALQTVGYRETFDYLEGKTDLQTCIELIAQHTRNYAKRQWTWFRKYPEMQWKRESNL